MKTLTLTQPWATLVALGEKQIETRSWCTSYRGPLAIHAAKGFPKEARRLAYHIEPFASVLKRHLIVPSHQWDKVREDLPRGFVLATCVLVDVLPTSSARVTALSAQERAFGDYSLGRYFFVLENIRLLEKPIPAKGALGLWEWEEDGP